MDKPKSVILDLRHPLSNFRSKVKHLVEGKVVKYVEEVETHVLANIFDNCEHWDEHQWAMCRTAADAVQRRFNIPDFLERREVYLAIVELTWDIARKIEHINLEEYGEFYYAFDRRLPNDAILLSKFWGHNSNEPWGGRRHANA